jgi:hypothetical protein
MAGDEAVLLFSLKPSGYGLMTPESFPELLGEPSIALYYKEILSSL